MSTSVIITLIICTTLVALTLINNTKGGKK